MCAQFDLVESEFGCCRAEPFMCRKPYEMFSFLLSRYRVKPEYDPNAPLTDATLTNHAQRSVTLSLICYSLILFHTYSRPGMILMLPSVSYRRL